MEEIDEIGHMESEFDDRKVADLGLAKAYPDDDGEGLRIEGSDDEGKPQGNRIRAKLDPWDGSAWTLDPQARLVDWSYQLGSAGWSEGRGRSRFSRYRLSPVI